MGGIPWQSKGCIDCRRRRIKCDEQRPECGRCIKRGLKCQGWEAFRNFVDGTSIQEAKNTMERKNPAILRTSTSMGQYSKVPALVHSGQITRQKVFGSFIERYTPSETLYSTVCFDNHVLSSIQNLPQKSWVIEVALSAISCVFLGRATKDPGISNHGLTLYNSAIRQVANMLQRGIYTKELFYITFIFQELNAVYAPDGMNPWGTHVAGMNVLLNHYRSKAKTDPIVDVICRYEQKAKLVLASTGTLTKFSDSEYNYLMEPTNGDPLLEVLQTSVSLKDLKVALDSVNPFDLSACQELLRQCHETHRKLVELSTEGFLGKDKPEYGSKFTDTCIPPTESLFGPAYRFKSLDNAMLFVMIWSHLVILWPLMHRAQSLVQFHGGSLAELNGLGSQDDLKLEDREVYADRIAQTMPFCFRKSTKMACARYSMFGLCIASFVYFETGNRAKHRWCKEVLDYITAQGYDIAGYLNEQASAIWALRWDSDPLTPVSQISEYDFSRGYLDYSDYSTLIRGI